MKIKIINKLVLVGLISSTILVTGCSSSYEVSKDPMEVTQTAEVKGNQSQSQTLDSKVTSTTEATKVLDKETSNKLSTIAFYLPNKELGKRQLTTEFYGSWDKGKDIACFEVFASKEASISGEYFKKVWESYWSANPALSKLKIGYYLSFTLNSSEVISKTIKSPEDVKEFFDFIEVYIYDDVNQVQGVWYTHLSQIKENTICTSIKLTAGSRIAEVKDIKLKAFTYSLDKEFSSVDGSYIGSNSFEIPVGRNR